MLNKKSCYKDRRPKINENNRPIVAKPHKRGTRPKGLIPLFIDGSGGIRTHVPLRTTAFRVRLVMTTSIRFHVENMLFVCGDYVNSNQVRNGRFVYVPPYEKDERYNYTREI